MAVNSIESLQIGKKIAPMLDEEAKKQIAEIWDSYVTANQNGFDKEGALVNNIDDSRLYAIEVVKIIIHNFMKGDFNIYDFKTSLDSYNKHNNLWGFTAKLGQMYFNQLIQANENTIEKLTNLLKEAITEPRNLKDAVSKVESLEKLTTSIYNKSRDKHNAPYPGAVGYFLSYFWQIHNHQKWPILYGSLVNSYNEIGIWKEHKTQKETYEFYCNLTNDIKEVIRTHTGKEVSNWDIEHAFWNYKPKAKAVPVSVPAKPEVQSSVAVETVSEVKEETKAEPLSDGMADMKEYIIPRLARLLEGETGGALYEQLVAESFDQMGFEVKILEQGRRREPYAIIKFREENIAFILDAKDSSQEYFQQNDERVIKEYIKEQSKLLRNEGYKKIGFILVCRSFSSDEREFVNYLIWNTNVKKVIMFTSEALLYTLAYRNRNRLSVAGMIEKMIAFSHMVSGSTIAGELGK